VNLYAESSAVLSWLLGEKAGARARQYLAGAEAVFASDLTLLECQRAIVRAVAVRAIGEAAGRELRGRLALVSRHWLMQGIHEEVVERAGRPFPGEPIRTLDAVHLASALILRERIPELTLLTLDVRLQRSAEELGLPVVP